MLRTIHICLGMLLFSMSLALPADYSNPKSQVEYISMQPGGQPKPLVVPITRPPLIDLTPAPPPSDSKNFAYNPITKTWTQISAHDPRPDEDSLVWNQSNDKWLTNPPVPENKLINKAV
ncbi:uncharacterized protein LOC117787828 [Drosophila innubila]|uniref:uncharacterized protein LOC117787828 n=1 Tax=Drosophila innubila TaxID=198719 RepID=UPI00148D3F52|nr:uncharacterized protein LOC117787828 [Drosophila innubila]